MKFKSLFLTTAAAMAFAACSSDEPSNGGNNGNTTDEGSTMYLTVNITDANAMGRADHNEGDLVPGEPNEHAVNTAHFFFFDKDKMFVTEANVWTGGDEDKFEPYPTPENPEKGYNVEFQSNNVLVLKNLTQKNLPKYLITVLNAPTNLLSYIRETPRKMDDVRKYCDNLTYKNGKYFVMSTSSFTGGPTDLYDDVCYYANVIKESFLKREPVDASSTTDVVKIYVERLAAKYTIRLPEGNPFKVDVTIAGNANNDNVENDGAGTIGSTPVWVKIQNFGVTGTEPTSYLSKNLDKVTNPFDNWNIAQLHRSYWGKSVNYDNKDFKLDYATYPTVTGDIEGAVYSNETTADFKNIRTNADAASALTPSRVTNVVFKATIYEDKDCSKPLDLILFSGVYYKKDQFIPYILNRLNATDQLNYYTLKATSSTPVEGGTVNREDYTQVSKDNVGYEKDTNKTGVFKLISTLGADTQLYQLVTENNKLVAKEVATSEFEKALNSYFLPSDLPTAYTGGASVYYVPVEHLEGKDAGFNGNYDYTVTKDGQYGVVRNHWYQIEVSKVFRLGQGVFDPSDNSTEELIPDNPSKETFGMAANISILSWKVVKQNVDL